VTRVLHKKDIYKQYVGLDGNMAHLMRPGMYGAYHHITVLGKENQPATHTYDVTGSLCENNDKFAIDRRLPEVEIGDILVIHDTGAHGHSMGFNYNGKPRSAELLLRPDGTVKLIRRAETVEDLFRTIVWEGIGAEAAAAALAGAVPLISHPPPQDATESGEDFLLCLFLTEARQEFPSKQLVPGHRRQGGKNAQIVDLPFRMAGDNKEQVHRPSRQTRETRYPGGKRPGRSHWSVPGSFYRGAIAIPWAETGGLFELTLDDLFGETDRCRDRGWHGRRFVRKTVSLIASRLLVL
jgi:hypothetical protein